MHSSHLNNCLNGRYIREEKLFNADILEMTEKRKYALLVDKDPIAIAFLQQSLELIGFDVVCQANLSSTDERFALEKTPDIFVLDAANTGVDTNTAVRIFDSNPDHHDVPIVVTNENVSDTEIKRSFDAEVVVSVPKPIALPSFIQQINKLVGWSVNRNVPARSPAIIVEDVNTTALIVQKLLDVLGVESYICNTKEMFHNYIKVIYPEIISLDLYLPDGHGLELCKSIRYERKLDELPIIIISGNTEMDVVVECLRAGANDHISKPIIKEEFFARVSNILKIRSMQKDLIVQQKQMEMLAFTDPLTTLFNRTYLDMALQRELERARRSGLPLGLLIIDLDFFKKVNDTYGHEIGDDVLKEFGILLRDKIRSYDVPCRYGGEEFCVLLPGSTAANVVTVAERVRKACDEHPFSDKSLHQTISIGTSVFPELSKENTLVSDADKALYSAKQSGRNRTIVNLPK